MTVRWSSRIGVAFLCCAMWSGCGDATYTSGSEEEGDCQGANCAPNDTQTSNTTDGVVFTTDGVLPDSVPATDQGPIPVPDTSAPPPDTGTPPVQNTAQEVDPNCIDGQYTELLPNPNADISGLISGYNSNQYMAFIYGVLDQRFPLGSWLVQQGGGTECVDYFLQPSEKATASGVLDMMGTLVHECGHFADMGGFSSDKYLIAQSLNFNCAQGDTTDRGGQTFARSLLNNDEYSSLRAPCPEGQWGSNCDSYAMIYLDGDPFDGNFDGGDQGFNSVLEETLQYVNSLATGQAFYNQSQWSSSERDGILTFLWYVTRYLRMARVTLADQYPNAYSTLSQNSCWREAILTIWGRAWMYLELTEGNPKLGIDDAQIINLVRDPQLLQEIQLLRDLQGCP